MRFNTAFRLFLYLTLISAAMVLAAAEYEPIYLGLMIGACVVHAAATAHRPDFALPGKVAAAMSVFAIAYAVYDLRTSEYILFSAAHFMLMLQIIKLFHIKRSRDIKEMHLMSLVLVGVSAVMAVEVVFAPAFVLYVVCAVASQMLFTIKQDAETGGAQPVVTRRIAVIGALLAGACLVGSAGVFLTFPRLGPSLGPLMTPASNALSGFSQSVHLRGSGRIESNPRIAFRAALSGPLAETVVPDELLWRGIALEHFDGTTWTITRPDVSPGRRPIRLPFNDVGDPANVLVQAIELAPTNPCVLFGVWEIKGASIISGHSVAVVHDKRRGSYSVRTPTMSTLRYVVRSEPPPPREILAVASGDVPKRIRQANTQLPADVFERVAPLARQIAPESECPTALEKAEAIESYLEDKYVYTTELPGYVDDPVGQFLFEKKKGHCEIFASAMTVMLRSLGVPARMVNGYAGGQWNEFLEEYLVRQANAHAWVEVYFPVRKDGENTGAWVQFDPSPAGAGAAGDGRGLLAYVSRIIDYVRVKWTDNVIYYGHDQQATLAKQLSDLLMSTVGWTGRPRRARSPAILSTLRWMVRIGAPLVAAGAMLVVACKVFNLRPRFGLNKASRSRTKFYRDLLKLLERRGHRREPSQTPLEFAGSVVAAEGPRWADVDTITRIFCDVRYGSNSQGAEVEARRMLERLRARKGITDTQGAHT